MEYGTVWSNQVDPHNWTARHNLALGNPHADEEPLVDMLALLEEFVKRYGEDGFLREGVAQLIVGTRVLLNAEWGRRLDMGSIDRRLEELARTIGFDLDVEEFTS